MNWEILTNSKLIESLGWTLAHSLWQIALIALILLAARRILRSFSANARHAAAVSALALTVFLPILTFVQLSQNTNLPASRNLNQSANFNEKVAGDARRGEYFSSEEKIKLETEAAAQKNTFGLIENLQNVFNENFTRVLPLAVGLWLLGIAFFGARFAGGIWQLHVYKTRKIQAPDPEWQDRFAALCGRLKIAQPVKLLRSKLIETPIVVGWLKPVILVPASVFLQISTRELETIIAHELLHIRRADAFVNFAQNLAETVFFYHPCVWWISREIRREREFATDAAVLEIFEDSRIVYANALANLEEIRLRANQTLPRYVTAANGGNLMHRIGKILQKNTEIKSNASAWSAGLALALISAVLLTVFSFNQTAVVNAQKQRAGRKLAIGFVAIPPLGIQTTPPVVISVQKTPTAVKGNSPEANSTTARILIEKLKAHNIPAIGFVLGGVISDGENLYPERADIVRMWRDAGLEVGIGNFRHLWFYDTPYEDFVAGVEKNEAITRKILAEKNLPLRYFSYPYLNTGKTAEDRTRFEAWLASRGMVPVKYTFDNQEWMYSYAYNQARAQNDAGAMNEVRAAFLKYMEEMFDHYEAYSQDMFGRDIAQTMVLTPSPLIADAADDLFGMIEKRGYKFVSMEEALADEAYKTEENFINTRDKIGKSGISWFERWSMSQGKKLRDEPQVDTQVQKIWDGTRRKSK